MGILHKLPIGVLMTKVMALSKAEASNTDKIGQRLDAGWGMIIF